MTKQGGQTNRNKFSDLKKIACKRSLMAMLSNLSIKFCEFDWIDYGIERIG